MGAVAGARRGSRAAGLEGLFRSDHYRSIGTGSPAGSLDAWTTLAALAARTQRLRLGTMVSPVTFRPASVLAKSVVTVDHVSGGRAELGIGAGWYEREHTAYGFPFLTTRERLDELDRQLEEITRQWTDGRRHLAEAGAAAAAADHRRRDREAAYRPRRGALRRRVQHRFPTVDEARERKEVLDAAAREAGPRPARLLDDDRLSRRSRRGRRGTAAAALSRRWAAATASGAGHRRAGRRAAACYESVGVERAMLQHRVHGDIEMVGAAGRGRGPSTLGPCA